MTASSNGRRICEPSSTPAMLIPKPWPHDMALCHELLGDVFTVLIGIENPRPRLLPLMRGVDSDDPPLDVAERATAFARLIEASVWMNS